MALLSSNKSSLCSGVHLPVRVVPLLLMTHFLNCAARWGLSGRQTPELNAAMANWILHLLVSGAEHTVKAEVAIGYLECALTSVCLMMSLRSFLQNCCVLATRSDFEAALWTHRRAECCGKSSPRCPNWSLNWVVPLSILSLFSVVQIYILKTLVMPPKQNCIIG